MSCTSASTFARYCAFVSDHGVTSPGPESWKELLSCRPAVMVSGLNLFAGHAVVSEREDGLPHIRVIDGLTADRPLGVNFLRRADEGDLQRGVSGEQSQQLRPGESGGAEHGGSDGLGLGHG